MKKSNFLFSVLFFSLLVFQPFYGQRNKRVKKTATISYPERAYESLSYRSIGPFRGGRSAAVTGVPGKPDLFYFGATGGGVWKTEDGGQTYENISDGFFGGSIGSVAVSKSDPNVIYVGGGEVTVRGNVSSGYGIWKTVDAGKTWIFSGLPESRHVPRIVIHPTNPDVVYAAVLGNIYKPTSERGVYKSIDGGKSWKKVLFSNSDSGAFELVMDPSNPRNLYASTWRLNRTPYSLNSGGEGSALWKSTDEGKTWIEISSNEGFAKGILGVIGVTVSPINSQRVWAIVENKDKGGVYRSDDGGSTWSHINDSRALRQRAWYYSKIYADTQDEDVVYVMNVSYHKSKDGGKTFKRNNAPHGDHHDLWIAPEDNQRMIIADDGGAQISYNGGETWSTYYNQPTAQFYRVTTDNAFPYRIYVAQQDNSTIRVAHRSEGSGISEADWESTAGGESAHIAVDPLNNDIVYGGSYGGYLTRVNHQTKTERGINVWPDNPMGYGAEGMKYRFQWNFPIIFSKHNPKRLYTFSNQVHVSENEGQSWEIISPDLTRNDPERLKSSGGPITQDNTGVEYYCTLFAANESPLEEGLLWVGSDDGLLHLTRDGGKNWKNVTPNQMPKWLMINSIDPSPFDPAVCYVAGTLYKTGDFTPYLYKTSDYGQTWSKITNGINKEHFTRVLRADPAKKGLLYAGTETGMYISYDDGASWNPFQLNLPIVPITDLTIKDNSLIVATQGRSLWMIDDLTIPPGKAFETNILLKKGKKFIVSKFRFFILWLFNCLKQVVTIPLKKILLIFVVPFICSLLSGENKYRILNAPYEDYLTVIVNEGGYIMKELIEDNLVGMYRKALNDPNYKYNILEPSNKLKKRFGDLSKYITKEEWKSSKCFLPLSLSDINENHSNTKSLIEDRNNILQCIENIVFFHSPKNKNVYFNYALYIGIYEEWLDKLNGKIFKILEEMLKHPCDYVIKEKDRNRIFQCNTLLKDRKYKYFELYIYDTNARVVRSIKISRKD